MTLTCFLYIPLKNLDQQNSVKDSGISHEIIDQIQRPSVDTLLDELNVRSSSPVYAVPHDEVINCHFFSRYFFGLCQQKKIFLRIFARKNIFYETSKNTFQFISK